MAVGCEPRRIAKTMSFLVDGAPVLIVLAGDAKVNNTKFKAAFHQKAKMLGHEQVAELTGFPGGRRVSVSGSGGRKGLSGRIA